MIVKLSRKSTNLTWRFKGSKYMCPSVAAALWPHTKELTRAEFEILPGDKPQKGMVLIRGLRTAGEGFEYKKIAVCQEAGGDVSIYNALYNSLELIGAPCWIRFK